MNVFTVPFLSADSGPWRKMSRACPAMSAIMASSGTTCLSHQESAWGAGNGYCRGCQKGHCSRVMLEYVLNTSTNVFCQYCYTLEAFLPRREGLRRVAVLASICQAS